jgi:predicted small secreted protein
MKRRTLILLMVGCLTIAACSNNTADSAGGNTASPGDTASPGSTANPGGTADPDSAAGPPTEAAPTSAFGLGGSATNPDAAASSPTSAPNPAAPGHGGSAANPPDAATPTPPEQTDPAGGDGPAPAAGPTGPLDQNTTHWFDTFCSTLATVATTRNDAADLNLGDAASMQSALIGALTTLGEVFHTATSTLAGLPPPAVAGGEQFAATVTAAFDQDAQQFAASAAALGTTDPEDTRAQADATVRLNADAETATNLIDPLNSPGIPTDTRAAIQRIPSCQTVWP